MSSVRLERKGRHRSTWCGPTAPIATLTQPGQPDRRIALPRRDLAECLAEELRRLDPDEVYEDDADQGPGAGRGGPVADRRAGRRQAGEAAVADRRGRQQAPRAGMRRRGHQRRQDRPAGRLGGAARAVVAPDVRDTGRQAAARVGRKAPREPAKKTTAKKATRSTPRRRRQEDGEEATAEGRASLVSASPSWSSTGTPSCWPRPVAARLVTRLVDARPPAGTRARGADRRRLGIGVLAAVAASPARDAVDWSRVHVWWGDERFLPAGDPDRNETQAREALLDACRSTRRGCTRCRRPTTRRRRRRRGGRARTPRSWPAWPRRGPADEVPGLRRPAARRRPGRARRLAVPRAAPALHETERTVVGGARLPQAAAAAGLADAAGDRGPRRSGWSRPARARPTAVGLALTRRRARCRRRPPGPRGPGARCGCSTGPPPPGVPPALSGSPARRSPLTRGGVVRQRMRPRSRSCCRASSRMASPSASLRRSFT